jgi:hypothetical protein
MGCQVARVIVLGSTGVADLVGIQATLLNKFVERKQYGIEASIRQPGGRGKERLFGEEDVYGIALVHWLFESGLRSQVIQRVLNQICGRKLDSKANDATARLLELKTEAVAIIRQVRAAGNAKEPEQTTRLCDLGQAAQLVRDGTGSVLIIPVGKQFASLRKELGGK